MSSVSVSGPLVYRRSMRSRSGRRAAHGFASPIGKSKTRICILVYAMWASTYTIGPVATPEPLIRPPLQRRSQESLERVLAAGLDVLMEHGFEGFTLQEVSRRAGVSIGSIYARVPSRDALILALHERAMAWSEEREPLERTAGREDLSPRERLEAIVIQEAETMLSHADILRVFMRQAPMNPDIWRRGAEKSQESYEAFRRAILSHRG